MRAGLTGRWLEDTAVVKCKCTREWAVTVHNGHAHAVHDVQEATVVAMETVDGYRHLVASARKESHVT